MLGAHLGLQPHYSYAPAAPQGPISLSFPDGFAWDQQRFPMQIRETNGTFQSDLVPRDLVDPAIWTGPAFHVDKATGDDGNTGLGTADGDFSQAKRSIHSAFTAGNATGAPYRVLIKPDQYEESAFTRNGRIEPEQPVAIIGWNGPVYYRTGPFRVNWSNAGSTFTAPVSSVKRVFRSDVLTPEGHYQELQKAADLAACQTETGTWFLDGGTVHVNIGEAPSHHNIALIRSFHGARFMRNTTDVYLENIHTEGGITGALHFDAVANRNIVGVDCSFRYSAPSNALVPLDGARVRRSNGLIAFFNCDASMAAKDGWSFHEDGTDGMHVILQNCTGFHNGIDPATSCNAFTTHDSVHAIVLGGHFGFSHNGSEVHCIQSTHTWMVGSHATAQDTDGSSVAYKCSNQSFMWLQNTTAEASGSALNYAIQANAGSVFIRDHTDVSGTHTTSVGGTILAF